jgi:hypothetical protein
LWISSFPMEIFSEIYLLRYVHDWEVDLVIAIFDLLYSLKLRQGGEDSVWLSSLRGSSFPWKSTWKVNVPLKVSFFVWTAALGQPNEKKKESSGMVLHM